MTIKGKVTDINIVYNLKNASDSFYDKIVNFSSYIKNTVNSFGDNWSDYQFQQFSTYIDSLVNQLENNAKIISDAVEILKAEIREV